MRAKNYVVLSSFEGVACTHCRDFVSEEMLSQPVVFRVLLGSASFEKPRNQHRH